MKGFSRKDQALMLDSLSVIADYLVNIDSDGARKALQALSILAELLTSDKLEVHHD